MVKESYLFSNLNRKIDTVLPVKIDEIGNLT